MRPLRENVRAEDGEKGWKWEEVTGMRPWIVASNVCVRSVTLDVWEEQLVYSRYTVHIPKSIY